MAKHEDDDLDAGTGAEVTSEEAAELESEAQPGTDDEHEELDEEEEASARRDSELDEARDEKEREQIRARRRAERKNKAQRQREKIDALEREKEMLKQQLNSLSQRVGGMENATLTQSLQTLEQEIARAQQAANHFSDIAADAVAKQDGKTWRDAADKADFAKRRLAELNGLKANITEANRRQQTQPQPLNPRVVSQANKFREKHSWYTGPESSDMDSQVLTQLDAALTREGWDPTSDAYWGELEARVNKYLPHRAAGQDNTNSNRDGKGEGRPRQPVAGSNSSGKAPGSGREYRLSEERVRAMKEAGVWNDPKKRAATIKRYQDYDREHGING